jgi:hypothetical protein
MPFPFPFLVGQLLLERLKAVILGVLVSVSHKIRLAGVGDLNKNVHRERYQDILVPVVVVMRNATQRRRTDRRELDSNLKKVRVARDRNHEPSMLHMAE